MTNKLGVRQLRANLHAVLDFVLTKNGRVVVTQHGEPIAEIVPVQTEQYPPVLRRLGSATASPAQSRRA